MALLPGAGPRPSTEPVLLSYDLLKEEQPDPSQQSTSSVAAANFRESSDNLDSYTRGIELSNACRKFYVSRLQVAEDIKSKLDGDLGSSGHRRLDDSMGKLRKEVVSLIDQDLSLMKQLLTLNERIEELKWQRKVAGYSPVSGTTCASSGNILGSDGYVASDWDQSTTLSVPDRLQPVIPTKYATSSDRDLVHSKYLSPSNLSVYRDCAYSSSEIYSKAARKSQQQQQQQRSTSDLGSSDEIVNCTVEEPKCRLSHADSILSYDCPSNSNTLERSDAVDGGRGAGPSQRFGSRGRSVHPDCHRTSALHGVDIRVHVEHDDSFESKEHSHDSGIQVSDHNMEMTI